MYYSNAALPVLPEYDTAAYPYCVVEFRYKKGQTDWHELRLYYAEAAFVYQDAPACICSKVSVTRWRSFSPKLGIWSGEQTRAGTPILVFGSVEDGFRRIWTSQTIADAQGRTVIPAGKMTGMDWNGLRSWLMGVVQGMSCVPFRAVETPEPEFPTEYSYNGTKLPRIPDDIAACSYILLCWVPSYNAYRLFASNSSGCRIDTSTGKLRNTASSNVTYRLSALTNGEWTQSWTQSVAGNWTITAYQVEPVWSNQNFYDRNGAMYLKGSTPKLVLREDPFVPFDANTFLLGWQMGRRLAQQRRGEVAE